MTGTRSEWTARPRKLSPLGAPATMMRKHAFQNRPTKCRKEGGLRLLAEALNPWHFQAVLHAACSGGENQAKEAERFRRWQWKLSAGELPLCRRAQRWGRETVEQGVPHICSSGLE